MAHAPIEFAPQIGDALYFKNGQLKGRWNVIEYDLSESVLADDDTIVCLRSGDGEMTASLGEIRKGILNNAIEVTLNKEM